jgi:hypothetical protein
MNSLQTNMTIPDAVNQLSNRVKGFMTSDQLLSTELWDIIDRLVSFRAAIAGKDRFSSNDSITFMLQLDSELERWTSTLPSSWRYDIHPCGPPMNIYIPNYHIYPGFSIATIWNQYRVVRCLVNEHLLTCIGGPPQIRSDFDPAALFVQFNRAKETIQSMCTDICASMPHFLRQADQSWPHRPVVGAMEIKWALFLCASMHYLPDELRVWAIGQLVNKGQGLWINQALSLANLAKSTITSVEL